MSSRDLRVLVVDDDANFRLLVHHVLAAADIESVEAGPGQDVLALARRERPDVILLDWRMPGESGLQLCRRLRDDELVGDVPVVVLTGLSDPRDRRSARKSGAWAMVTKSARLDLVEVVRDAARGVRGSDHAAAPR